MNNNDDIKKILEHAKPDAMMAVEALKKANDTIRALVGQLQMAEERWVEMFTVVGTVLNKFGREVRLSEKDLIPLDPMTYKITVEHDKATDERIVRLRELTLDKENKG